MENRVILFVLGLTFLFSVALIGCDDSNDRCDKEIVGLVTDEIECEDFAIADNCSSFEFTPPNECDIFNCTRNCPDSGGD